MKVEHFTTPLADDQYVLGYQLADLRNDGSLELIQGGYQRDTDDLSYAPSMGLLFARDRTGDFGYTTRAVLPFAHEFLISATPVSGATYGISGTAVLLVTRTRDQPLSRFRVIEGANWAVRKLCDIDVVATAAHVAPDVEGGPQRLFVQDANSIHIYSLPELDEIRVLASAGGTGFTIAQLDDDVAQEVIVAATPGRVIDL
jgi:hypothetical protein